MAVALLLPREHRPYRIMRRLTFDSNTSCPLSLLIRTLLRIRFLFSERAARIRLCRRCWLLGGLVTMFYSAMFLGDRFAKFQGYWKIWKFFFFFFY